MSRDADRLILEEVSEFGRAVSALPVTPHVSTEELRAHLAAHYSFDKPLSLPHVLPDVMAMLRNWTLHCTHPRYFGLFNPSVHDAGVWADTLTALYNPQLGAWEHAPAACEIEQHTLRFLATALGMDSARVAAHFTTGGSEANQTAVLAALASRCPDVLLQGLQGISERPTVYVTAETHHSFQKIMKGAGLGLGALRYVPTAPSLQMDPAALEAMLITDQANGLTPILVVGTAGTTGAGVIDPLAEIADVCGDHRVWFHVDAAWGGAAAFAPGLRAYLAGIERADSITWDAHKWLSVPMGAGMFFTRHPAVLHRVFSVDASYVPRGSDVASDLYQSSLQWSRRFIGLKVFLTLVTLGTGGIAANIEHQIAMGNALRALLAGRGWEVVNDTPLPIVCFTHPDIRRGQITTAEIIDAVRASGTAWLSDVVLGGRERVLRACVTSYRTSDADVTMLADALEVGLLSR